MDIEKFEKISVAGKKTRDVRNMLKQYKEERQDAFEGVSEIYKPLIDTQKSVKETIDEKQDKLIEQLEKNQKAITSGLENVFILNQLPEQIDEPKTTLPIDYKPLMMAEKHKYKSDMDKGFNEVLKGIRNNTIDFDDYDNELGKIIKKTASEKGGLSKSKKMKEQNVDRINVLTKEIKILQKYKNRINLIPEGLKTVGEGLYTQKKRNAYKVDKNGIYGGLIIDLPKLFGQLKMIAHKDGKKVYDKQADFDTIDLFTKRYNSGKKYSPLSREIFNDINTLSEIPIHRTSNKFKKLGSGVIYYNNPEDLLSRLELLGGSILAGNNALNKIGVASNDQLNDLLREYVI
ncbi:uncharacterized protein PF3D7_1120000-like [Montipora foliosa]|uniref:uncharacterized protein PF3D7_1120000-like n=1 Tax=Montipora foliosa TaxID=591990 RepID=UPI0035F1FDB4